MHELVIIETIKMFITFYNAYFPSSVTHHSDKIRGKWLLGGFVFALLSTATVPASAVVQ